MYQAKDVVASNTWSSSGLPQVPSGRSKFSKSLYFDGNSYLSQTMNDNFSIGSGDFTVDWWEYKTSFGTHPVTLSIGTSANMYGLLVGNYESGNNVAYASSNGTSWDILSGFSLGSAVLNVWNHFALVRKGSTFYGFKNGTLTGTATSSLSIIGASTPSQAIVKVGDWGFDASRKFIGCLDELRVSKCARWTSSFTPAVFPYSKIRFLAKTSDGHYHTFLNSTWSDLGVPADNATLRSMFTTNEVIDNYDKQTLDKLTTTELPKICAFQLNTTEPLLTSTVTAVPERMLILEKNDVDLKIASYVDWVKANSGTAVYQSGGGVLRFIVSHDSGKTWSTYSSTTSAWTTVLDTTDAGSGSLNGDGVFVPSDAALDSIKASGLTVDQLVATPISDFTVGSGYKVIRFGVYLEVTASTDVALVDNIQFQFDGQGTWRLGANYTHYTVDTSNTSHTVTWLTAINAKRVKVNY